MALSPRHKTVLIALLAFVAGGVLVKFVAIPAVFP